MRKLIIAIGVGLTALLVVGGVVAWAYDHSRRDTIPEGVSVAGVDVGGMKPAAARAELEDRLLGRLREPVVATFRGKRVVLSPERARVAIDVDGTVDEALERGRDGSFVSRVAREVTGGEADVAVRPEVTYSRLAVEHFMAEVVDRFDRDPRDASVAFSPTSLDPVSAQDGITVERRRLRRSVVRALTTSTAPHEVPVRVHTVKPKVTTAELAAKYPVVITVDRGSFELRLWKDLKLVKTYPIAVGAIGLETPAGLYTIQNKQVDPTWNVPNSDWAGDLAGQAIPPGPSNPLKARWMGIYNGAGIHGTDSIDSLGTAASHGCVRMAVPDVIDLYDQTPVGAPVYIA
ncbi:MAG TPA: L,D-transpeptidase family protein [Conexibacter sp.]|nr:L,D-transpeptidase family protein [Conexibacter sp.]